MADTTVALAGIPDVELMQAGTWNLSTGPVTFTTEDLAAAVEALQCPAVRNPVLKLGHTDPRFDGEPTIGWVGNLHTTDDGFTLAGDYQGMPQWLADVCASAYPDRSIEGSYGFVCQIGHSHPFVVTAVALLGVTAPGVGTLDSLQDVAALYGVEASSPRPWRIEAGAGMGRVAAGAAGVSVEDVRREFYDQAAWSLWIVEFDLEPLQLIVCDEDEGEYQRIPITVNADGTFTFEAPIAVQQQYVDMPETEPGEATNASRPIPVAPVVFASRAESRAGYDTPPDSPRIVVEASGQTALEVPSRIPAAGSQEGAEMDSALLRQSLGLTPEATDDEVRAALATSGLVSEPEVPAPVPALPDGLAVIDADTLAGLQVAAAAGADAAGQLARQDRDGTIAAAVRAGKIAPARRDHYASSWDADPEGTRAILASLAPGLVPVDPAGYRGNDEVSTEDEAFERLFSRPAAQEA